MGGKILNSQINKPKEHVQKTHQNELLHVDQPETSIKRTSRTAGHFGYGSMGGFYTLAEVEAKLDEMSTDFPDLATPKFSIGKTHEGRDIWAVNRP